MRKTNGPKKSTSSFIPPVGLIDLCEMAIWGLKRENEQELRDIINQHFTFFKKRLYSRQGGCTVPPLLTLWVNGERRSEKPFVIFLIYTAFLRHD